jgi:hypothetical protein
VRITDRTRLSEASGRELFDPEQFVSGLSEGWAADGSLNRRPQVRSLPGVPGTAKYSLGRDGDNPP